MTEDQRRLTTRETAERLGVKPETVYAYVSRGLLTSRRGPGGRGSTFAADEVDTLLRRGRRDRPTAAETAFTGGTLRTGITLIEEDRYFFRGVDATELAEAYGYEDVAEWLWTGRMEPGTRFSASTETTTAARQAVAALPRHSGPMDRLRVAVTAAATADPLRFDTTEERVLATGRTLIATLVDALPPVAAEAPPGASVAERLWPRLTPRVPEGPGIAVLDRALTLLIDHDLAASTLAVRVAASARAHPYAAVSAGLGAVDGPLHGAASGLAHRMLSEVLERGSAAAVVADHLRAGRRIPGIGHRLYPGPDPRAVALFGALGETPWAEPALAAARDVAAVVARHTDRHPNVDLALAVLSVAAGMPAESGETLFAVARTAGWLAHALEEYREAPLRMRPRGEYRGPRPPQPLP
ncbi:citrate synthase [Streptomyces meridianus]|uniref:citrate synthase (unknown stereospecificity) n=1 Tax=Streptomyces meridianus TaxID=2938945 RepID=A0ABT0XAU4_9ACTN|nr:citrate synthase [Streptomyces meridianus]MCM2578837.1 citrate synthase [Streptomyces meridianus]